MDWLTPTERTATSLAVLVFLLIWESCSPFFAFFRRRAVERARHGAINLLLGLINAAVTALVFVSLWWWVARLAATHHFGLLQWLGMPPVLRIPAALLLFDLWMYAWHRLSHRVPLLWRFHRTHHSDPRMDVTTANRFHLGEMAISGLLRAPVIALLGMNLGELALYELCMFTVVQMQHANIALPAWLDRALRAVIVTPFMHKVHHSRWQPETDSNYSSLFSFWDRVFGSFRLREDPRTIQFGLDGFDHPEKQSLSGLMKTPFAQTADSSGNVSPQPHHRPE